jgi:hypothetical protein
MSDIELEQTCSKTLNVELLIMADKEKKKYLVTSQITANSRRISFCICFVIGLIIIISILLIILLL